MPLVQVIHWYYHLSLPRRLWIFEGPQIIYQIGGYFLGVFFLQICLLLNLNIQFYFAKWLQLYHQLYLLKSVNCRVQGEPRVEDVAGPIVGDGPDEQKRVVVWRVAVVEGGPGLVVS